MTDGQSKAWQPSRRPTHWQGSPIEEGKVIELEEPLGPFGRIGRFFKRPFVRLVIGLGIFILAAIVYDETVNFGSWTERQEKPKQTHRGAADIPQAPE